MRCVAQGNPHSGARLNAHSQVGVAQSTLWK